jgi:hypothetical protein
VGDPRITVHALIIAGVIAQVNRETGLNLSFESLTPGGAILARRPKGNLHAIVCYNSSIEPIIRSVVKERRSGYGFAWLINGQAGKGAVQVAYWDEDHRFKPNPKEAAGGLQKLYGDEWKETLQRLKSKGFYTNIPKHLTLEEILRA